MIYFFNEIKTESIFIFIFTYVIIMTLIIVWGDLMYFKDVLIIENKEIKPNNFRLTFLDKEIADATKMGQFVEIKVGSGVENLLRKPISINDVDGDKVSLLYRAVGKGTKALGDYKIGDKISIIGPLGLGFPEIKDKEILIVAGGIGCGPFNLVMRKMENWKLFYGCRDKCEFLLDDILEKEKDRVFISTDNGTIGNKGFVTEELEEYLKNDSKDKLVFSCGPEIMMKAVQKICDKYEVESYLSLEAYMGCGIGVCNGCAQKIKNSEKKDGWEMKKVCKDGPVFKGSDIIWE